MEYRIKHADFAHKLSPKETSGLTLLLCEQFSISSDHVGGLEVFEKRIKKCFATKNLILIIASEQKIVVGYLVIHLLQELWAEQPEALISSLYVSASKRNQGIASLLLEYACNVSKENNYARTWLETNRKNQPYKELFYQNRGLNEREDIAIFEYPF
jgi:ribosomal protein S18 acetylase RimI-like enzyme